MKPYPLKAFLLRFAAFLLLGLILWVFLEPSYSRLLVSVSQSALRRVERKERTDLEQRKGMFLIIPSGPAFKGQREKTKVGAGDIGSIHYNSVILFALFLSSPGLSLGRRLGLFLAGWAILFPTQVLTLIIQVKFYYVFQLGEYSRLHYGGPLERNLYAFLKQFFLLVGRFSFPFAIWMLLTSRKTMSYFLERAREGIPAKGKAR